MTLNIVTTHQNADLDGMASMLALWLWRGPLELALPAGMDPDTHRFWQEQAAVLPAILPQHHLKRRLQTEPLGRLYVADTADPRRIGFLGEHAKDFAEVLAWDTHPAAPNDLPRAPLPPLQRAAGACTSALVLQLHEAAVVPPAVFAGAFLLGIHQDTGHFTFVGTTAIDHRAASLCLDWGAPPDWPSRYVPKGLTRAQLARLEEMSRRVEMVETHSQTHQVALTSLELADYEPNLAVLVEQLREAEGWQAAVAVAAMGERTFCVGRAAGHLDMGALMRDLGGGGHSEAASAVLRGVTLDEAMRLVRQGLRDLLDHQLTAGALASRPILSLPATATVRDAADALHRLRVNALPLWRGRGAARSYVGVASRQDVDAALRHGFAARPVLDISSHAPAWVDPKAPLSEVRQQLVAGPRRLLLVGTPPDAVGVVTRGLVLRATAPAPAGGGHRPPQPAVVMSMVRKQVGAGWPLLERLADIANRLALPLYLVGGSVRDLFLGVPGRDLDLLVEGDAPVLVRAAAAELGGAVDVPENFGTARWYPVDQPPIDFASARSEYYAAPAALPVVEHASLNQDLFRRDFTVNAMALALSGPQAGRVFDPYNGFTDLRAGVLRVLHGLSFHDDPTRAFRAVRFAARFDFQLAPDTAGLLKAAVRAGVLERLSHERVGGELELLLAEADVVQGFRLLRQFSLHKRIHPKFHADRGFLDRLRAAQQARLRLAGQIPEVPPQADVLWLVVAGGLTAHERSARSRFVDGGRQRRQRWLTGPERLQEAVEVFEKATGKDVHARWCRALAALDGAERVCLFATLPRARQRQHIIWWENTGHAIRTVVTGDTLRQHGFTAGPHFKRALAAALDVARSGGDAAAQLQAARAALTGPGPKA